jgi:hypothetical protein
METLAVTITAVAAFFGWRRLLYKEEQYTLNGWLCLATCVVLTLSVGKYMIS